MEKKSNYIGLLDEDGMDRFYYSTNHRYLVNAATFEIVTVTSQNIRAMLDALSSNSSNSTENLNLAWKLAKEDASIKR